MNLEFTEPQNLGTLLMKSSQSNSNLRSPSSCLARSYLIATVYEPRVMQFLQYMVFGLKQLYGV